MRSNCRRITGGADSWGRLGVRIVPDDCGHWLAPGRCESVDRPERCARRARGSLDRRARERQGLGSSGAWLARAARGRTRMGALRPRRPETRRRCADALGRKRTRRRAAKPAALRTGQGSAIRACRGLRRLGRGDRRGGHDHRPALGQGLPVRSPGVRASNLLSRQPHDLPEHGRTPLRVLEYRREARRERFAVPLPRRLRALALFVGARRATIEERVRTEQQVVA